MDVILLGDGGHSKVIQEMIHLQTDYRIIAILDDKYELLYKEDHKIYGPLGYLNKIISVKTKVVIAIGDNTTRKQLSERLFMPADKYLTVVHPSAIISNSATIGHGTVVMPGVCVNAGTR